MRTEDYSCLPGNMKAVAVRTTFAQAFSGTAAARDVSTLSYLPDLSCVRSDGYVLSKGGYVVPGQADSVPVCYAHADVCTFVDFRSTAVNWNHVFRKVYNSVLTLVRAGELTLSEARGRIAYVLVGTAGASRQQNARQPSPTERPDELDNLHGHWRRAYAHEPWDETMEEILGQDLDHDVRKLSGFLVRKAYRIYLDEADDFAKCMGWGN